MGLEVHTSLRNIQKKDKNHKQSRDITLSLDSDEFTFKDAILLFVELHATPTVQVQKKPERMACDAGQEGFKI